MSDYAYNRFHFGITLDWKFCSNLCHGLSTIFICYLLAVQLSDSNARISRCSVALDGDMKNHCGKGALEKIAVEFTHISKCRASKSNK